MSKKKKVVQFQPLSLKNYIKQIARKLPIYKCWSLNEEDIEEAGINQIVVARQKKNGSFIVGYYLTDPFCLGLKNTFYKELEDEDDILEIFENLDNNLQEVEPNYAFNYVYGAIEYAGDLGFSPHKDFSITEFILDDVEDIDFIDIEFGKNGKPLYISGPFDDIKRIMGILNRAVGEGNYDTLEVDDNFFDDLNPIWEELAEINNLEEDEFSKRIMANIAEMEKHDKPFYTKIVLDTMLVDKFIENNYDDDTDELQEAYVLDPASIRYRLQEFSKESRDIQDEQEDALFLRIALENSIKYEGNAYLLLKDFVKSCKVNFEEGLIKDDELNAGMLFLFSFEKKRFIFLNALMEYFSDKEFGKSNYKSLSKKDHSIVVDYTLEAIFNEEIEIDEMAEDFVNGYHEISNYLPDIDRLNLQFLILNME